MNPVGYALTIEQTMCICTYVHSSEYDLMGM